MIEGGELPVIVGAVGDYVTKTHGEGPMEATWQHNRWGRAKDLRLPANAKPDAGLTSISCPNSTTCMIVGDYTAKNGSSVPMALTLARGRWSAPKPLAAVPANAAKHAEPAADTVSCWRSSCETLGIYIGATGSQFWMAIGETNGHWGKAVQTPMPANAAGGTGQRGDYPYEVSCTSKGWCTGVGTFIPVSGEAQSMATTRS